MKRKLLIACPLLVVVVTAATLWAQTPAASSHAAVEKQIVALERAINEAVAKGDMKAFHANIAADAIGIDPSGINKVNAPDFDKMLLASKIQSWNLDGSQFLLDQTTLPSCTCTDGREKGTYEGQPVPSPTWASTVWLNKAGKWMAVFHQETTAMPAPPAAKPAAAPAPGRK
jgi:hypothetical protein